MELHRIQLHVGARIACRLVEVVRDHHDTMPGPWRDRPGSDRVRLEMPSGDVLLVDLWTRGGQDLAHAPEWLEVFDHGDVLMWRALEVSHLRCAPANEHLFRVAS